MEIYEFHGLVDNCPALLSGDEEGLINLDLHTQALIFETKQFQSELHFLILKRSKKYVKLTNFTFVTHALSHGRTTNERLGGRLRGSKLSKTKVVKTNFFKSTEIWSFTYFLDECSVYNSYLRRALTPCHRLNSSADFKNMIPFPWSRKIALWKVVAWA